MLMTYTGEHKGDGEVGSKGDGEKKKHRHSTRARPLRPTRRRDGTDEARTGVCTKGMARRRWQRGRDGRVVRRVVHHVLPSHRVLKRRRDVSSLGHRRSAQNWLHAVQFHETTLSPCKYTMAVS